MNYKEMYTLYLGTRKERIQDVIELVNISFLSFCGSNSTLTFILDIFNTLSWKLQWFEITLERLYNISFGKNFHFSDCK